MWDLATGAPAGGPFTGHTDTVRAVAATELDGRPVVISGSDDQTVRVWDPATGELDGRPVVISGGDDRTVRVWDLATGAPAGVPFTGHTGYVLAVAAAELDGRPVVISGSSDRTVRVWDLATGAPAGVPFTGHTGWVLAVAAAELDGRPVVISGSSDRTVRVWDLATGAPIGKPFTVRSGRLRWWQSADDAQTSDPFTGHTGLVRTVAAAELDGRPVVISGSDDRTVRVWDLATGAPIGKPFTGHTGLVRTVAAAELDGRPVVISGSDDQTVRVWDLAKRRAMRYRLHIRLPHEAPVDAAILTRRENGLNVIVGCRDGVSQIWDLSARLTLSRTITPGRSGIRAMITLVSDHVLYANSRTISLYAYRAANTATPILTVELESEIHALVAHGTSTVVAATGLGLVALKVPH
jgi:WD40 repeat protein